MPDIRELTLEEAKKQLKMNLSLIEMLKGNTPLWAIARFRASTTSPSGQMTRG